MSEFYCDIYGLSFELKNDKLAIIIDGKKHWVDVPVRAQKKLSEAVKSHFDSIEAESKLTPEQLREKYAEMMGS